MAKLSLSQSPKFKMLVRALGIPNPYVRGYLELLWESAHFRDDPFFISFDSIEATADWQGEPGVFAQTLLDRNWIESNGQGYLIHDYEEHLPGYVKERRRKAEYRKTVLVKSQDSPRKVQGQSRDNTGTIHPMEWKGMERNGMERNEKEESLVCKEAHSVGNCSEQFEKFWSLYPKSKRVDKNMCWKKWQKRKLDAIADKIMKGLENNINSEQWNKDGGQFITLSTTWINQSRWLQELPPIIRQGVRQELTPETKRKMGLS